MKSCYVEFHQLGAGRSRRERDSDGPADAECDSDDGLFITQKPEPEATRSRRRRLPDPRPESTSPRHREEDEAGPSLPASLGESKSVKTRRIRNLPKYSLSFVTETRPRAPWVSAQQSKTLHHHAMGSFFKCVRELWQRGDDPQAPLPTVDVDGENISPLTDDEDAWSESEDIKVVERTRFVARLKAKNSQPRHITEKGGSSVKRQKRSAGEGQEVSRRTPTQIQNKTPVKASTAFPLDNHNVDLTEKETSDKHFTSDGSILVHTESPGTNTRLTRVSKILFQRKEREEELHDESDATYCDESELQGGSPWEHTEKDREASPNVTEPQAGVFTTDNLSQAEDEPESQSLLRHLPECVTDGNNERVCNVTGAKGDHERGDQSQEEPEGLPAARSLCVEAEEPPGPTEDDRAEPPATQTSDELELNEENQMENLSHGDILARQEERRIHDSKLSKKRRKKNKLAADDVGQEQDGNRESEVRAEKDSLFSLTCSLANGGEEKKKKRKRVGDEQLQSSVLQPLDDAAETQRKKEKLVDMKETLNKSSDLPLISKEQLGETGHRLENTGSSQATEDYESLQEKGGESREEPGGLPAARSVHSEAEETPGPTEDDRAEPPATQTGDELELNEENGMENLSRGDIPTRQEERRIPDSKLSKKRRKKNKLAADDVGQEQDGNRESEVRAEKDSLFSLTCNVENGGEEKKTKKRKRVGDEQLQSSVLQPLNDAAETQRKKEKKLVNMEERGEEETLNMALHLPLILKEQFEKTGHSLENTEKKKKKKRKIIVGCDGDIEQLQSSAASEPPIDDAEIQRKKKRQKKEKTLVNTEEQGEEDALNMTSDLPHMSKEPETGRCSLENTESSQERLEASFEKKRKKKRRLSDPNDEAHAAVEDGVELNNVTMEESTEQSVKKKKKKRRERISEGVDVSCTPDKNKKADNVEHSQKTKEGPDDRDAESVTKKKKKKKKSEMFSRDVSEDAVAQSADSRSVRKKEKRRTPSFLAADAEEKEAQTQEEVEQSVSTFSKSVVVSAVADESAETAGNVEESNDGVRKKKRKRKKSEAQKDHERDFEEANETCLGALPEAADAGKERKKKLKGNESESVSAAGRSERADDAGHCQTDEAAAFKKKKKNKVAPHHATQGRTDDVEPEGDASIICSSVSLSRKDKQSACPSALQRSPDRRAAVSHDQRTSDKSSKEARNKPHLAPPPSQTPVNPVVNGVRDKKEKKKEHKQTKRQLHNPSEDFLTNC